MQAHNQQEVNTKLTSDLSEVDQLQLGRRNISDDQRAVIGKELNKRLSKIEMAQRRREAGKASGEARKAKSNGEVKTSSPLKKPKKHVRDRSKETRKAVAKDHSDPGQLPGFDCHAAKPSAALKR